VSLPAGSDIRAVDAVAPNNDLLRRPLPDAATCGG